ncbi:hypothetical protein [Paenibacillus marinisediminis]
MEWKGAMVVDLASTVEQIVRELLQSLQAAASPSIQVLYVLDDSRASEAYMDQFVALERSGIQYDLLVLDGEASGWLGTKCIECTGAGKCIAVDEHAPAPIEIPHQYDAVVIPELDLDQAARVAFGLKGTIKSELILAALVLDKPVFIASDCSGLKRADRRTLKALQLPVGYDRRYRQVLKQLEELGVRMAEMNQLAQLAIQFLLPSEATSAQLDARFEYTGKLLTAEAALQMVRQVGSSGAVMVKQGTIISPLARDVLREHRAELRITGEVNSDVSR